MHERHDILLVDQRGTGGSHPLACARRRRPDVGEDQGLHRVAERRLDAVRDGGRRDDLEAVRAALGYRTLNLYGISYGATLAQVYLARHPRSVRTVSSTGRRSSTSPSSPIRVNGQRALDLVASAARASCLRARSRMDAQLRALIEAWNAKPVKVAPELTLTGTTSPE